MAELPHQRLHHKQEGDEAMIQKLWCFFIGHKVTFKDYLDDGLINTITIGAPVKVWQRSEFCLRCGKVPE